MDEVCRIHRLSVSYATKKGQLKALRRVSFSIPRGRIVGLVGESGCGKSTLILALLRLLAENAGIMEGAIDLLGKDVLKMTPDQLRQMRGKDVSMVFQDPMTSLNPVVSIGRLMTDIQFREKISAGEKRKRAADMLTVVGISDAMSRLENFPHHFSGGMRQRIAIAMALLARPSLLIADEPTTALDATLALQIIRLLRDLKDQMGCAILFVSHSLGLIADLSDHVVVMYAGEVVEEGSVRDIFHRAVHPYTRKLLECDPARIQKPTRNLPTIQGEIPDLVNLPEGCIFQDRCPDVSSPCRTKAPERTRISPGHFAACHLVFNGGEA